MYFVLRMNLTYPMMKHLIVITECKYIQIQIQIRMYTNKEDVSDAYTFPRSLTWIVQQ
jgi:hypothetical protein